MIDMPLGASLRELMRQLAVYINKADQTSAGDELPDDEGEKAILKHWINEGYAKFMRSDPRWSFLRRKVIVPVSNTVSEHNVNGETWRVRLPSFVRGFPSPCEFSAQRDDTFISTLCLRSPEWIDRNIALDGTRTTGIPQYFSCRPVPADTRRGQDGLGKPQSDDWEAIFYPRPSRDYTVAATFPVRWCKLVDLDDRSFAGSEHDQAIVFAAEMLFVSRDSEEPMRRAEAMTRWMEALEESRMLDFAKRLPASPSRSSRSVERVSWTVGDNAKQVTP